MNMTVVKFVSLIITDQEQVAVNQLNTFLQSKKIGVIREYNYTAN
jgi:hypothetical protein